MSPKVLGRLSWWMAMAMIATSLAVACAPAATPTAAVTSAQPAATVTRVPTATAPLIPTAVPTAIPTPARTVVPIPSPAGERPKRGGTLRTITSADTNALDGRRVESVVGARPLNAVYINALMTIPTTWEIGPDMFDQWSVSKDGLTWKFHVREGMTWHDGKPVTGADMWYNFQTIMTRPNNIPMPNSAPLREQVAKVEQTGPMEVTFTLKAPKASFFATLSIFYIFMVPKHIAEVVDGPGRGRDFRVDEVIGAGPFRLKRYDRGVAWEFERFERYWDQPKPWVDKLVYYVVPDDSTRDAVFETGQVDLTQAFPSPKWSIMARWKERFGDKVVVRSTPEYSSNTLQFNVTKPPFDNPRVREAINLAIDRSAINKLILEGYGVTDGLLSTRFDWIYPQAYYDKLPGYRSEGKQEDIAKGRQIINEIFGPRGLKMTITTRRFGLYAAEVQVVRDQLKAINVEADIRVMESAAGFAAYQAGDFELLRHDHAYLFFDPDAHIERVYLPTGGRNWGQWSNAEFIRLYEEESVELDRAKRGALLRRMVDILVKDNAYLMSAAQQRPYVFWSYVKNYSEPPAPTSTTNSRLDWVWLDK